MRARATHTATHRTHQATDTMWNYRAVSRHPTLQMKSLPYFGALCVYVGGEFSSYVVYLVVLDGHDFATTPGWVGTVATAWAGSAGRSSRR